MRKYLLFFFFFQAEDGIRDGTVTGVQTCALPIYGPTFHPQDGKEAEWPGEAKVAGRAVPAGPIGDGPDGDLFHADISEVVLTRLNLEATLLVIESWTPQRGLRVTERE